mgnify:CR=1 FL=1
MIRHPGHARLSLPNQMRVCVHKSKSAYNIENTNILYVHLLMLETINETK